MKKTCILHEDCEAHDRNVRTRLVRIAAGAVAALLGAGLVAILLAGCGPAFTEESASEPDVLILETGAWQAPEPEDVCVDRPRAVRPGPDAGGGRR